MKALVLRPFFLQRVLQSVIIFSGTTQQTFFGDRPAWSVADGQLTAKVSPFPPPSPRPARKARKSLHRAGPAPPHFAGIG